MLPAAIVLLALGSTFYGTIETLYQQWIGHDDFSYGLLIAPIAAFLVFGKRSELQRARIGTDWWALMGLGGSLALAVIGELRAELFTVRVSVIGLFIGAIWFIYGFEVVKILRLPMLFLFLMLPIPGLIHKNLTFSLQLISSKLAVDLLQLIGVSVYREGNLIDMGFAQYQVVEACNGLRYILPLFVLGVLFAFTAPKQTWKRLVLVAATVPLAILANVLRIAGTGIISIYMGTESAHGFFHSFSGAAVFLVCFVLLLLLNRLLELISSETAFIPNPTPENKDRRPCRALQYTRRPYRFSWKALLIALLVIVPAPRITAVLGSVPPRTLVKPLNAFPKSFDGYSGVAGQIDAEIWERVGGQDYIMIDYRKPAQMPVDFYAAFYTHQRKAGSFIHSPKLCLPGSGWHIEAQRTRTIIQDNTAAAQETGSLSINELVINKNDCRQLVYYWYQGRGRRLTNEYMAKLTMVWDGIWKRRTDGALVRLMTPLQGSDATSIASGRLTLDRFARFACRQLNEHLP